MYTNGQVIHNLDTGLPYIMKDIWDRTVYPQRHVHYIFRRFPKQIFASGSIEAAVLLLRYNVIHPAPRSLEQCWDCAVWLDGRKHASWCKTLALGIG